jgi:hypothetical protein
MRWVLDIENRLAEILPAPANDSGDETAVLPALPAGGELLTESQKRAAWRIGCSGDASPRDVRGGLLGASRSHSASEDHA